jgi:hypothetical protein
MCKVFYKTMRGTQFSLRYYFGDNCTVKIVLKNYVCTICHNVQTKNSHTVTTLLCYIVDMLRVGRAFSCMAMLVSIS